jgi:hypothetical protein
MSAYCGWPTRNASRIESAVGRFEPRLVACFSNGCRAAVAARTEDFYEFCERLSIWDLDALRLALADEGRKIYAQMVQSTEAQVGRQDHDQPLRAEFSGQDTSGRLRAWWNRLRFIRGHRSQLAAEREAPLSPPPWSEVCCPGMPRVLIQRVRDRVHKPRPGESCRVSRCLLIRSWSTLCWATPLCRAQPREQGRLSACKDAVTPTTSSLEIRACGALAILVGMGISLVQLKPNCKTDHRARELEAACGDRSGWPMSIA